MKLCTFTLLFIVALTTQVLTQDKKAPAPPAAPKSAPPKPKSAPSSGSGDSKGVKIQLPQTVIAQKQEKNLNCLLNVLRQFDYKRTPKDLPALDRLNKYLTPGLDRPIDLNTF